MGGTTEGLNFQHPWVDEIIKTPDKKVIAGGEKQSRSITFLFHGFVKTAAESLNILNLGAKEMECVNLAIIIPYWKGTFISKTLHSIASQTDHRFHLYICDDSSNDPLEKNVNLAQIGINNLTFHRFENRLGRKSLIAHWHRSIAITNEPWVWLFSDDDMMEPNCVASFCRTLEATNASFDIYRFKSAIIDEEDRIIALNPAPPEWESWNEFTYFLLNEMRFPNQQEVIFRRERFEKIGGFPDFPLAWWSDVAFTISCGTPRGIGGIKNGRVFFRKSNLNVSSDRSRNTYREKLIAMIQFMEWLSCHIENNGCKTFPTKEELWRLSKKHFFQRLKRRNAWIKMKELKYLAGKSRSLFGISSSEAYARMIHCNWNYILQLLKKSLVPKRLMIRN